MRGCVSIYGVSDNLIFGTRTWFRMSAANNKVPPKLEDESSYETWKKDIEIWC